MKVAIIGATGYGGVELVKLLQFHPEVTLHSIHTSSQEGKTINESYPHLTRIIEKDLTEIDVKKIASEVDLVFTSTPTGVSRKLVPDLLAEGVRVVDLSGDYRLKDGKQYKEWYDLEPGDQATIDAALYGLTEWVTEDMTDVAFVSNPGCFPTSVLLGLAPVVQENLIEEHSIIIDAKTGASGAGRGLSAATHFSDTNENIKIYRVNEHQHIPEIEQTLATWNKGIEAVTFSTHLVPMTRGIMSTMYVQAKEDVNEEQLFNLYNDIYKDDYFVRVRQAGQYPSTKEVAGSNFCDISLAYDERTKRITIITVIDNLVKGAAGQAVQNMNRMFGLDETTGLKIAPVYP
ncbi:MAG TPA: N-acetyl-gamma-glutamyl-phosphate reductase [Bacillota bacterium]|nr:N-acetyl-gamma-glutamyl-phosphate reductase [Bacillota bacterium]